MTTRTPLSPSRKLALPAFCSMATTGLLSLGLFTSVRPASAQEPNPTSVAGPKGVAAVTQNGDIFFYKVTATQRDIDAVNYLHRSGTTQIGFVGTNLLPEARGEANVKSERGGISVHAEFKGLRPANSFGPAFLTYVLWAISPDGRPQNLGEVLPAGSKNNIDVTVSLQSFGMIVTAEPYFSVSTPSDVVILKNVVDSTLGVQEKVNAHATLMPRGFYEAATSGQNTVTRPVTRDERSPLELYEAYNAIAIAQSAGADKYSPQIIATANQDLKNAADMDSNKHRDDNAKKMEITFAREAVQKAEDARIDTLRKEAAERQRNAEDAKNRAQADAAASAAEAANSQAQAQAATAQAERDRLAAENAKLQTEQAKMAQANADLLAQQARAKELEANQRANAANARAANAEQMREKLRAQLNAVLQTTETPRGLVVNLSDVLFDTGKYTLKPGTQVSLARIAGIFQSYPGLKIQVEGYTDSVGGDDYNQKLSQNRADTTRDFLEKQGVAAENISSMGYGKADPVADNTNAAGRALNRRVNLVVSGDAIGVAQSSPGSGQDR